MVKVNIGLDSDCNTKSYSLIVSKPLFLGSYLREVTKDDIIRNGQ